MSDASVSANSGPDKILVCGSRTWSDSSRVYDVLKAVSFLWEMVVGPKPIIIHGDAAGADKIAGHCAKRLGLEVQAFPADWQTHGKRAGYLRNVEMAEQRPELVLAFQKDSSRGTQMMIDIAFERRINILLFRDPEPLDRLEADFRKVVEGVR